MNFFGLGLPEIVFILLLLLLLFGPQDLARNGRAVGRFLNRLVRSPEWKILSETGKTIRDLPTRLMREANLEDITRTVDSAPPLQGNRAPTDFAGTIRPPTVPPPAPPEKRQSTDETGHG